MTAAMESKESSNGSKGNVLQKVEQQPTEGNVSLEIGLHGEDRTKSIAQQIDYSVNSLQIDLCSLEFIREAERNN